MNTASSRRHLMRTLSLVLLGSAAQLLSGCADSPGNGTNTGTTTSGSTTGNTSGSCASSTNCPMVTVLLDGKTVDNLADATDHAVATWTSTNTDMTDGSKPCTASGGIGGSSDPWTGAFAYQSTGYPDAAQGLVEQPTQNGVYTFVLTCINTTGDGASAAAATLNVGPINANSSPITVTVTAAPSSITLGETSTLTWTALDSNGGADGSITCTHTSSPADATWNGASTAASGMVTVTPNATVVYTYVLTCTNAAGGSGAGASAVDVLDSTNPQLVQCPAGEEFADYRNTSTTDTTYSATADTSGLCLGCSVTPNPPANLVAPLTAANANDSAAISIPIGLLIDGASIKISSTNVITPQTLPGNPVGFIISEPGNPILSLAALQNISVATLAADGSTVQKAGGLTAVNLDLLSLFTDATKRAVVLNATLPYKSVQLTVGGIANVITAVNVFGAGACVAPSTTGSTSGGTTGGTSTGGTSGG